MLIEIGRESSPIFRNFGINKPKESNDMASYGSAIFAFVFPSQLEIVQADPQTYKQVLTLYNPYHFPVKFRVKCTNPKNYVVMKPHGMLKESSSLDIVVRHVAAQLESNRGLDTFRVEVSPAHLEMYSGSIDVPVRIVEEATCSTSSHNSVFKSSSSNSAVNIISTEFLPVSESQHRLNSPSFMSCMCVVGICAVVLMLPTEGLDVVTTVPSWLHLSVQVKLIFAYILGLCTLLISRQS
ncbi:unnamed protein product [Thelazia callipaeda]|uniref:Motile sperm domain-containing protein 1 n=1 Tax=Thelazia callipaeda TaxID=103827 RepID=A0A0N5D735_THECL|nr:unnamed protein product [Thelazia callipaeda]